MKKLSVFIIGAVFIAGCGKTIDYSNDFSAAIFLNASPDNIPFNVIIDGFNQTGGGLPYRSNSPYLNIQPGTRNVSVRVGTVDFVSKTGENFVTNTASTFVVYDTLPAPNQGPFRTIRLKDDLSVPKDSTIKVRYLPLAINAPASDITFVRTTVTPRDSVTITNQSYIGSSPSESTIAALAQFIEIPAGNYTIKQKAAGTQTVLSTFPLLDTRIGGIYKGIFTVYSAGTAKGQPLTINTLRHFP